MRRNSNVMKRLALALFALAFAAFATAQIEDWLDEEDLARCHAFENHDYRTHALDAKELEPLGEDVLMCLRGIIFGRHGRIFREALIDLYLRSRPWYKPDKKFTNEALNDVERANLDLVREAEAKHRTYVLPGDLRFWKDREIDEDAMAYGYGVSDLTVMIAEIEAIHGRRFDESPSLQKYFEERYWYRPKAEYDPSVLSEMERKNLETLRVALREVRGLKVGPGSMLEYQTRRLTAEELIGLSLHELRLMRNEVYALRGYTFKAEWLRMHFEMEEWYEPGEPPFPPLEYTENRNVALILARERTIHESLAESAIDERLLDGLWLEDLRNLRNEIYARRGKVFRTKWLQSYFQSFDWYKADPMFRDSDLTQVERRNVAVIAKMEKQAMSRFDAVEG